MEYKNEDEIYVAVVSRKAKIRCVHTDDLYIAYFLRKNNPALHKVALYTLASFPALNLPQLLAS